MLDSSFLGIDIGSVSVCASLVDTQGEVLRTAYKFHRGKPRETLRSMLGELGPASLSGIASASPGPAFLRGARSIDPQVSLVTACGKLFPSAESLLFVGGEKFGLIRLAEGGRYRGARVNSSCAAGTGSFLDQQARRLGFTGADELARRALECGTPPPKISTRCAVFARTDLVHAQQAGYSLEEISDGLCRGLAQNIADALLGGESPGKLVVFAGGVALNAAVRKHLEELFGVPVIAHAHAPVFAAIGAALCLRDQGDGKGSAVLEPGSLDRLFDAEEPGGKQYFFAPLDIGGEGAPGSDGVTRSLFASGRFSAAHPVEVEVYRPPGSEAREVRMGVDVGSTSTKAILVDASLEPMAGFYTRTLGSPLTATQAICEAVADFAAREGVRLPFLGVATTGAGRKFIGSLIRADLVVDEITAHARAAYALDPEIDTIIEIGGQDAKFTTMHDGMVTFSHMNTVCAAGTGSFLEEQAARLGCDLSAYEERVRGARAPLASDRCAVFMERDINNFLGQGFSPEEILAACLFSVRENYLQKVSRGAAVGARIAFQGATARNRALVAAFREGLGRPILVSRYCHLTGALGAALLLADGGILAARGCAIAGFSEKERLPSAFIGLAALREEIPVRTETCGLCANHCRLRVATVAGENVAYGFLCGRDYDVERYVDRNRSGFDLLKERRKAFARALPTPAPTAGPVIGIPAALGLFGHLPLWRDFFAYLGIPVITSEDFDKGIERGREVQGAEFCAPIAALHGHARHLLEKADYVFLPVQLEESRPGTRAPSVYCYYTQFSSALVSAVGEAGDRARCLMPQLSWSRWRDRSKRELHECLSRVVPGGLARAAVSRAFDRAAAGYEAGIRRLQKRFREELASSDGPSVVLLGRPYNVLSPEMSKGIPGIFGSLGIKTFSQDMVPYERRDVAGIAPLLDAVHWLHAAKILEAAWIIANTPNLYPVYVTSFKCAPDSFALEYFRRILDARAKPYLILQLDDHDSTLGYETRIEAGVASFRNHASRSRQVGARQALPYNPRVGTKLAGKTLLFPAWDPLVNPLLAANLRREGIDARVLEEDPLVIRKAMRHNTGQCIPLNVIVQETIEYIGAHGLDPSRTALWTIRSFLGCNLGMFHAFSKSLLEASGGGMERVDVYTGDISHIEISPRATLNAYRAYLVGGLLRRVACRLRPYEKERGAVERALASAMDILVPAFEGKTPPDAALERMVALFEGIAIEPGRKPKVAIFGDLYVRDNDVMNQGLIGAIEGAGGEAVTTPYTEYLRIVVNAYFRKYFAAKEYWRFLEYRTIWAAATALGRKYSAHFERILGPQRVVDVGGSDWILEKFGLRSEHAGESFDNLLKVFHILKEHPDLALFVQASPAFCCPSLVTEAMGKDIERLTGVPVVCITYDGTGQYKNEAIVPYLLAAAAAQARPGRARPGRPISSPLSGSSPSP